MIGRGGVGAVGAVGAVQAQAEGVEPAVEQLGISLHNQLTFDCSFVVVFFVVVLFDMIYFVFAFIFVLQHKLLVYVF